MKNAIRITSLLMAAVVLLTLSPTAAEVVPPTPPSLYDAQSLSNRRIHVPAIDSGDEFGSGNWETQLHVQNVGEAPTSLILLGWQAHSGLCSAPGPQYRLSSGEIGPGVAMTWEVELPEDMESGIVYSVTPEQFSAAWDASADALNGTEDWLAWEALWEVNWSGEPLTAVVMRSGPNDFGTMVSSAYTGISRQMEGTGPPYLYFAPYVANGYYDLDTELTIERLN